MPGLWNFLSVLVWPLALLVFFWPLRKRVAGEWPALSQFVRNFRRGKVTGPGVALEIEVAEQQRAVDAGAPADTPLPGPFPPLSGPQVEPVRKIKADLAAQLDVITQDQRVPILLEALARSRLQYGHEFVYNRIFGSQVAALERLRDVGSATEEEAKGFFTPFAERHPEVFQNYGFNGWRGFLVSMGLVEVVDGRYRITPAGRAFLSYVDDQKLVKKAF